MYKLPRSLPKAKAKAEAEATAEAEAEAEVEAAAVEVAARTKYACCASQSSKTAWQCNGPCGLWFHEPCMKKCGDPSNYLGIKCCQKAKEALEAPREKRACFSDGAAGHS